MLALHEKCFLIFVFSDMNLPAINGISNQGEEIVFPAFDASLA